MSHHILRCSVFFFSSRRRHTRYWRDWSSDVCSSDLDAHQRLLVTDFNVAPREEVQKLAVGPEVSEVELHARVLRLYAYVRERALVALGRRRPPQGFSREAFLRHLARLQTHGLIFGPRTRVAGHMRKSASRDPERQQRGGRRRVKVCAA